MSQNPRLDSGSRAENVREFMSSRARIRLHDCFTNAADILPEFCNVVRILEVIPATMCSAERSFNALRRLKTDQRSTMGRQCASNIEPLKAHMPIL